jgi:hypothetical protein
VNAGCVAFSQYYVSVYTKPSGGQVGYQKDSFLEHADFVLKGPKMRSTQLKHRSGVEGVWTLTGAQEYCNYIVIKTVFYRRAEYPSRSPSP